MHGYNGKAEPKSRGKQRLIFFRGSIKKAALVSIRVLYFGLIKIAG